MSNSIKKDIDKSLKFVYSDNNSLSVIFHDNELLMGVVGEFNKNLKELEMLNVYLSGEIHSDWRQEIINLCNKENLEISFSSPITNHEASDNCGVEILGNEEKNFWKDNKGANINSIKTRKSIKDCDIVVVKFGDKYKQWNAAFDAGY